MHSMIAHYTGKGGISEADMVGSHFEYRSPEWRINDKLKEPLQLSLQSSLYRKAQLYHIILVVQANTWFPNTSRKKTKNFTSGTNMKAERELRPKKRLISGLKSHIPLLLCYWQIYKYNNGQKGGLIHSKTQI